MLSQRFFGIKNAGANINMLNVNSSTELVDRICRSTLHLPIYEDLIAARNSQQVKMYGIVESDDFVAYVTTK